MYGAGEYDNYPLISPFCVPPWEDEQEDEEPDERIEPWEIRETDGEEQ